LSGDAVQIAIGALQGLGASTVFVLVLFIGFCVVVGFTKTKKNSRRDRGCRQEPGRADYAPADGVSGAYRAAGAGGSTEGPELLEAAARRS